MIKEYNSFLNKIFKKDFYKEYFSENINSIFIFGFGYKNIPEIPEKYNNIISFSCYDNKLKKLPKLPEKLEYLRCDRNLLEELPKLPDCLEYLFCDRNYLIKLPELPNSLIQLNCENNSFECPIDKDIIKKFKMNIKDLYRIEKENEYKTLEYQKFLFENYLNKFVDIKYSFDELGIEFHQEIIDKYEYLFTSNEFNLI